MSKQTKPLSWCWNYFDRKEEKDASGKLSFVGYCQFCNARYVTHANRMEKHLQECKKVGAEARKQINRLLKKTTDEPPKKINKESEEDSARPSTGIRSFFDSVGKEDQEEADILLTRALVTGNIAANFLDNPFFKQFVAKLRPSYKLPSREYKFPKVLVPAEFNRVKESMDVAINKADFLAVSSDGWSDINTNKIINVVVHTPKPYLYNSIDTKEEVHDGKYIAKILAEEIEAVGKHKVVAVVTDHAANMRKAWEILEKAYPWILFEGCKAHMLNLAAKDICQRTMVALRVKFCQDIVRFFRKSKPQKILSKIQLEKMGSSTLLQLPIETRWGTYAKLINSIIANESCLKEAIWNAGIQDNRVLKRQSDDIRLLLCSDEEFWPALKQISKVITPLAEAIRKIEGNEVNSRSAYKTIKDAFAEAKRGVNESEFEFGNDMMELLEDREEFGRTDVTYLMDLMEPSNRGEGLTNEEKQASIEILANKLNKNPVFAGKQQQLMTEWGQWLAKTGIFAEDKRRYAWDAVNTMDALTWWTAFFSDTLLSKVAQLLSNIPISSAATERNWSLRGAIHTSIRNRLKVDTTSQLVFIKHNLLLEYADLFKRGKVTVEEESDDEELFEENDFELLMQDVD